MGEHASDAVSLSCWVLLLLLSTLELGAGSICDPGP